MPLLGGRVFVQEGGEGALDGVVLALPVMDAGSALNGPSPSLLRLVPGCGDGLVDGQRPLDIAVVEKFIACVQVQGDVRRGAGNLIRDARGGGRPGAGADTAGRGHGEECGQQQEGERRQASAAGYSASGVRPVIR